MKPHSVFPAVFAAALSAFVAPCVSAAPAKDIFPTPQQVKPAGSQKIPASALSAAAARKYPSIAAACRHFKGKKIAPAGPVNIVFEKDGATLKKRLAAAKVKPREGAYWLNVTPKGIWISAADADGEFYAVQTIARMIDIDGEIACGEVLDWPDVPFRGVVEGYYGDPWHPDARISQYELYGKFKMNTYIYGPKDDKYHHAHWWEPYPKEQAELLRKQIKAATDNHVRFVWAAHVGSIINNPGNADADMKKLVDKFELMYGLGVRAFGVFFDDIFTHNGELQARVCNYVQENFIAKKNDVAPLVMCPSQYNKGWSGGDYLDVLGEKLHPSINVMWTGDSVCTDITEGTVDWVSKRIRRAPYIWWNWPVIDYARSAALCMGRTYGLDPKTKGKIVGMTANPMDKPEASKIGVFGTGCWAWNTGAFDSQRSWKEGFALVYPGVSAKAMYEFSKHNSDLGPNGHGYRKEESVDFLPTLEAAKKELEGGKLSAGTKKALVAEFEKMSAAGRRLAKEMPKANPRLWHELEYWIKGFSMLGEAGEATVEMAGAGTPEKKLEAAGRVAKAFDRIEHYSEARMKRSNEETVIGRKDSNALKVAGLHVTPFVREAFRGEWAKLCRQVGASAGVAAAAGGEGSGFVVVTDVPTLKSAEPVREEGKFVRLKKFEPFTLAPKQFVGIGLPEGIHGEYVHLRLENKDASKSGAVEVSRDGVKWEKLKTENKGAELEGRLDAGRKIRFFRYVNTSGKPLNIKLEEFKFDVPADAKATSRASMTDGDPFSGYAFSSAATLPAEKGARRTFVLSSDPASVKVEADGSIKIAPPKGKSVTVFEILRAK